MPIGFDAVHHDLQRRLQSQRRRGRSGRSDRTGGRANCWRRSGWPAPARELTALLYLVDLAVRYLTDRQAEAGARLGVLGTWLLPVLIRRVEEL